MISFGNGGVGSNEPQEPTDEEALQVLQEELGAEVIAEYHDSHNMQFVASDVNNLVCTQCLSCLCHKALILERECDGIRDNIAHFENKPEYILIAAVCEDPHAFDGMWYPTALSEDGIGMIEDDVMGVQNLFFIHVSTDVEGLV